MARVLVADDNADTRDALALILCAAGHAVIGAADGQEAVDAYRAKPSDVLVLDLLMPRLDGVRDAWMLKSEFPSLRDFPRVAGRRVRRARLCAQLGAAVAILEPVDPAVVLQGQSKSFSRSAPDIVRHISCGALHTDPRSCEVAQTTATVAPRNARPQRPHAIGPALAP